MTDYARPIRLILDTSAITAFTAGSIAVGELLAEIDDENAAAGLPVLCLAEATRTTVDADRLTLLANHHATTLLTIHPADWRSLATTAHQYVGQADAASAVLAAIEHDCDILTNVPGIYAGLDDDGGPIIAI